MAEKTIAKLPNGEVAWTRYCNKNGDTVFVVTSKPTREFYMLYERVDGGYVRLGRAKSPGELETKYEARMRSLMA